AFLSFMANKFPNSPSTFTRFEILFFLKSQIVMCFCGKSGGTSSSKGSSSDAAISTLLLSIKHAELMKVPKSGYKELLSNNRGLLKHSAISNNSTLSTGCHAQPQTIKYLLSGLIESL